MKYLGGKFVVLTAVIVAALALFTHAAPAKAESGQAFSISPPLIQLSADPNQTVQASIKLTNISSGTLLIKTQVNDFGAKNETGDPSILFDADKTMPFSLHNWIGSPAPFQISSHETKTINFPIKVPKDAEPGGHYAVIRFTGNPPSLEQNGVALSASVGSLVLMKVSGNVQEKASVADFYSTTPNFSKKSFFENGPVGFVERIHNEGNIHVQPTGTVAVKDMFGRTVTTMRVNGIPNDTKNPPKNILPQSIRRFNGTLQKKWLFGRYTAAMNLSYGDKKTMQAETHFWVIPYKIIVSVFVILIGLILLIRMSIKRYKARIIREAQKNQAPTVVENEPIKPVDDETHTPPQE